MKFAIDFFELAFLAEACIPPRPIARTMFFHNLTDKYWIMMSEKEQRHLFEWITKCNDFNIKDQDCFDFYNRFNPDNQYEVHTNYPKGDIIQIYKAYLQDGKYYVKRNTWIDPKYILTSNKL